MQPPISQQQMTNFSCSPTLPPPSLIIFHDAVELCPKIQMSSNDDIFLRQPFFGCPPPIHGLPKRNLPQHSIFFLSEHWCPWFTGSAGVGCSRWESGSGTLGSPARPPSLAKDRGSLCRASSCNEPSLQEQHLGHRAGLKTSLKANLQVGIRVRTNDHQAGLQL